MGSLLPKTPSYTTTANTTTEKASLEDIRKAAEEEKQKYKYQKGRASTILSDSGTNTASGLSAKTLLGG